jgi:hypothetical protein
MIGINMIVDNKLSKELLGMSYENYSLKDTIIEMGYSLIQQGLVDDLRKKPL